MLKVARKLRSWEVIDALNELLLKRGMPKHIRSDNGSEFIARQVRKWLAILEVKPLYIEPGSPWENGFVESFHGKFRDELLSLEQFDNLWEAEVLVERWRKEYNEIRPHSALGYLPPAPQTVEFGASSNKVVLPDEAQRGVILSGKSSGASPLQPCQKVGDFVYS